MNGRLPEGYSTIACVNFPARKVGKYSKYKRAIRALKLQARMSRKSLKTFMAQSDKPEALNWLQNKKAS